MQIHGIDSSLFGIRFNVSGTELRNHCLARAKYHEGRKAFYEKQAKIFGKEVEVLVKADVAKYSNSVTSSNKDRMIQSKNHHADKERFFKFAASHLKRSDYDMDHDEVAQFEMIPRD